MIFIGFSDTKYTRNAKRFGPLLISLALIATIFCFIEKTTNTSIFYDKESTRRALNVVPQSKGKLLKSQPSSMKYSPANDPVATDPRSVTLKKQQSTGEGNNDGLLNDKMLDRFIVIPRYKLLFCYMEKVGCTMFNMLLDELQKGSDPIGFFQNSPEAHNMSKADLEQVMTDPEWTKAVFYREPKERFLSGYQSKCMKGHDGDGLFNCKSSFGVYDVSFDEVLEKLKTDGGIVRAKNNVHFKDAGDYCGGLKNTIQHYDVVERLEKDTAPMAIQNMLEKAGVEHPMVDILVDKYARTEKTGEKEHTTNSRNKICEYFSTPEKIQLIEDVYDEDYKLFNLNRNEPLC